MEQRSEKSICRLGLRREVREMIFVDDARETGPFSTLRPCKRIQYAVLENIVELPVYRGFVHTLTHRSGQLLRNSTSLLY